MERKANYIPEGYHSVTPYLVVTDVSGLVDFLQAAFDGKEEVQRSHRPDGSVMHAEVRIGDSVVMMGETTGDVTSFPAMLYLYLEDADAAYRQALEAGAISLQEPVDETYGDRVAAVQDAYGNQWWLATYMGEGDTKS
jgi:PhnB protein